MDGIGPTSYPPPATASAYPRPPIPYPPQLNENRPPELPPRDIMRPVSNGKHYQLSCMCMCMCVCVCVCV